MTLHNENIRENFNQVNFVEIKDKRPKRIRNWNVTPSQFSLNTLNPIRAIVEHLKIEPNPEKTFIPLSVGEQHRFSQFYFHYINIIRLTKQIIPFLNNNTPFAKKSKSCLRFNGSHFGVAPKAGLFEFSINANERLRVFSICVFFFENFM